MKATSPAAVTPSQQQEEDLQRFLRKMRHRKDIEKMKYAMDCVGASNLNPDPIQEHEERLENPVEYDHIEASERKRRKIEADNADNLSVIYDLRLEEVTSAINLCLKNRISTLHIAHHPSAHSLKSIYVKVLNLIHTSATMYDYFETMYRLFFVRKPEVPTVELLPKIFFDMIDYLIVKVFADDLFDLQYYIDITTDEVDESDVVIAWKGLLVRPVLYKDVCNCIRDGCIIDFNESRRHSFRTSSAPLYKEYFPESIRKPRQEPATNGTTNGNTVAQVVSEQVNVKVHIIGHGYDTVTSVTVSCDESILSIKQLLERIDQIPPVSENKMMCDSTHLKDEVRLADIRNLLKEKPVGFEFLYVVSKPRK
jgi:hypothetical protein